MILVLPNALPPAGVARELGNRLAGVAPTLVSWLAASPAAVENIDLSEQACTALQAWQLRHAGYTPPPGVPLGAGWSVIERQGRDAMQDRTEPVWLAAFVHLHVSQQGVTMTDPSSLGLEPDEAGRLLETARPYLEEEGIRAEPVDDIRLRLFLPSSLKPYAPTPQAAAGQEIQEWWPQTAALRPWRRVLNVIQMAWHDDPVNTSRLAQGRQPVNGLWLYGGGAPADFAATAAEPARIVSEFSNAAAAGDWAAWLDAAARMEQELFAPLEAERRQTSLELVLTGEDRYCTLALPSVRGVARWLPRRRHDWQSWWNGPRERSAD